MNVYKKILTPSLAILLLVIQSCGSGSIEDSPASGGNRPPASLNTALKGSFLWSSYSGDSQKLDISTGRWGDIQVIQNWIDENKNLRNIDNLYDSFTRFTKDGQFALKVIQDCDVEVGGVLDDIIAQCIVVFDLQNQTIIGEFTLAPVTSAFLESIALSDDGQYIAILDDNSFDQYRLRIFDLKGNKIKESLYADYLAGEFVKVDSLEWLPDDRLIFSYGPVIMRSIESLSTSARGVKVFARSAGEPVHLRISPDGKKIAFALKTDSTFVSLNSTLWVMDVDGSNAYQLVEALGTTQPEMNNPAWSQDGKWIAFEFGGVGAISGVSPGVASGILVVPSNARKELVDYNTAKTSEKLFRISSYYTPGRDDWSVVENQRLRDSFPEGRVTWIMP